MPKTYSDHISREDHNALVRLVRWLTSCHQGGLLQVPQADFDAYVGWVAPRLGGLDLLAETRGRPIGSKGRGARQLSSGFRVSLLLDDDAPSPVLYADLFGYDALVRETGYTDSYLRTRLATGRGQMILRQRGYHVQRLALPVVQAAQHDTAPGCLPRILERARQAQLAAHQPRRPPARHLRQSDLEDAEMPAPARPLPDPNRHRRPYVDRRT